MSELPLITEIKSKAKTLKKHIVLPDGVDERAIQAARKLADQDILRTTLIGNEQEIYVKAEKLNVSLSGIPVIEPAKSEMKEEFAKLFAEIRKSKGITLEDAKKNNVAPPFFWRHDGTAGIDRWQRGRLNLDDR